ncbi:hypothetical protein [Sphingomonas sp.]|uniref:hypothetical protein n=1 Tax=Sphingomonas sp. TaxID=28214 RepID=UPI0025F4697B|nr:hypothetical protein [Sphingomonas sp.]
MPMGAAEAVPVSVFLPRAEALVRRGPLALFSRDFYRLKAIIEADGDRLKADYAEAKAAGKPSFFCPPARGKPRVGKSEYLAALRAVPAGRRASTDTKDVLQRLLERKYPCPTTSL